MNNNKNPNGLNNKNSTKNNNNKDSKIDLFLKWELKVKSYKKTLLPVQGSYQKRFFRIHTDKGSWILAKWLKDANPAPDNIDNFYEKYKCFKKAGVSVPEVKAIDKKLCVVLMQDVGGLSLKDKVCSPLVFDYYKQAIDNMIKLKEFRVRAWQKFKPEDFFKEMLWTKEYLLTQFLQIALKKSLEDKCYREWEEICYMLAEYPYQPAHRDYHSSNLMLKDNTLFVIDFAGAGLFPRCYDLASLLYDPYVAPYINTHFRQKVCEYLISKKECSRGALGEGEKELLLTAIQRLFKASGSFASFYTLRGQKSHLPFIMPALTELQNLLEKSQHYPCFLQLVINMQKKLKKL